MTTPNDPDTTGRDDELDEGRRTGRAIEAARRAADDPQRPPAHTLRSDSSQARDPERGRPGE
jgi:hypothetical protein